MKIIFRVDKNKLKLINGKMIRVCKVCGKRADCRPVVSVSGRSFMVCAPCAMSDAFLRYPVGGGVVSRFIKK